MPRTIANSVTNRLMRSRYHWLAMGGINMRARQTNSTPIFVAAREGIIVGMERLITPENVNRPNEHGTTPLAEAAEHGQEAAVRWLLAHGANPGIADARGNRAIDKARAAGFIRIVDIFLEPIMHDIDELARQTNSTPIFVAAHDGIIEGLERLVTPANVNTPNAQGATLLAEAAGHNQEAAVRWLLAHGANQEITDQRGDRPITKARAAGHNRIVDILIEPVMQQLNARARQINITPIFVAAHDGIIAGLEHLVTPENINEQNDEGVTLLAEAAEHGHEAVVQWLLAHGANPDIADDRGDRAIDRAEVSGANAIVNMLTNHELHRKGIDVAPAVPADEPMEAPTDGATPATPAIECPLCLDETHDVLTLPCNHQYCRGCLNLQLGVAIREQDSHTLVCPNPGCRNPQGIRTPLEIEQIRLFASKRKVDAFEAIKTKEALIAFGIKHCPTPGCINQFDVDGDQPMLRRCDVCTRRYCVQCLAAHPDSISCQAARAARNTSDTDRASEEWKRLNTKQCPNCHVNIQRSEGCNHMTCRHCMHEFCWLCMINWPGYSRHACPTYGGDAPVAAPVVAGAPAPGVGIDIAHAGPRPGIPAPLFDAALEARLARERAARLAAINDPFNYYR